MCGICEVGEIPNYVRRARHENRQRTPAALFACSAFPREAAFLVYDHLLDLTFDGELSSKIELMNLHRATRAGKGTGFLFEGIR